jgi:hypothetical protein
VVSPRVCKTLAFGCGSSILPRPTSYETTTPVRYPGRAYLCAQASGRGLSDDLAV